MRALLVVLGVWLSACVYGPSGALRPITEAEGAAVDEARAAWAAAELDPEGEDCAEDLARGMQVARALSHEQMFQMTGYCGPADDASDGDREGGIECRWGRHVGVYRRMREGGVWPFALANPERVLFVAWRDLSPERVVRLVRHEAVHWLQDCTGRFWLPEDPHGDPEVWCPEGCPGYLRAP